MKSPLRIRILLASLALTILLTTWIVLYGPSARQARNLALAEAHVPLVRDALGKDGDFSSLTVTPFTGNGGSILVLGLLQHPEEADQIRTRVEATDPPVPIVYSLRDAGMEDPTSLQVGDRPPGRGTFDPERNATVFGQEVTGIPGGLDLARGTYDPPDPVGVTVKLNAYYDLEGNIVDPATPGWGWRVMFMDFVVTGPGEYSGRKFGMHHDGVISAGHPREIAEHGKLYRVLLGRKDLTSEEEAYFCSIMLDFQPVDPEPGKEGGER